MSTPNNAAPISDSVLYESDGPARIYKLNRPKALNALDMDMVQSLAKEVNVGTFGYTSGIWAAD